MKISPFMCAALATALLPAAAFADDPKDPSMRNAEARARDRVETRRLNLAALQDVRGREARGELGWRPAQSNDYQSASADYARDRARYERQMAEWRRAVAACRAGDYSACDN
jgi:hypothetical protein